MSRTVFKGKPLPPDARGIPFIIKPPEGVVMQSRLKHSLCLSLALLAAGSAFAAAPASAPAAQPVAAQTQPGQPAGASGTVANVGHKPNYAMLEALTAEVPLEQGITIKHVLPGNGAMPSPTSTVSVLYMGMLADGTVFDASNRHGSAPLTFQLNSVIPCWTIGLQKMRVGEAALLKCPAKTAYGEKGAGNGVIPPNADLTFRIKLVAVK
jgi:FKBP-type peptidyl-prolyl cis-trans isomerase FkpA